MSQSPISPLPLIVKTVPSSDQVQSPITPLVISSAAKELTAIIGSEVIIIKIDNNNEMLFFVLFILLSPNIMG